HRPTNRTLAVIEGGIQKEPEFRRFQRLQNRSCWSKSGRRFGPGTIVTVQKKPMSIGLEDLSFFTTNVIWWKWARQKSVSFFLAWQLTPMSALPRKTKPSMLSCFSTVRF